MGGCCCCLNTKARGVARMKRLHDDRRFDLVQSQNRIQAKLDGVAGAEAVRRTRRRTSTVGKWAKVEMLQHCTLIAHDTGGKGGLSRCILASLMPCQY